MQVTATDSDKTSAQVSDRPSISTSSTLDSVDEQHIFDKERGDLEADAGVKPIGEPKLELTPSSEEQPDNALFRVLSKVRTADDFDPGPAPDGGFRAWLTAVLAHLVIFNTWGFIKSFGVFQTYYVETAKIGSESDVAWIGSVQMWVLFIMGTFTGRALDGGYFKITFVVGSIINLFGIFMLSLCKTYWQVFLAQTLCVGVGFGCQFVPSLALLSTYFSKNRAIAMGIAVTGSTTGGVIFPAIAETMLPKAGYAWTVRTMGFVMAAVVIACSIFMKPRLPPRKSGPLVEWSAFKEAPYTLYICGGFFFFWSVYIVFYFIGTFGINVLGISNSTSISVLMVVNGAGLIGRLVPTFLCARFGPLNVLIPIVAITGVLAYCWLAVKSVGALWAFVVVYGTVASGIQGMWPIVLAYLTKDPQKQGTRTGMAFGVVAFAVLTGTPIAGAIIQGMDGSYVGLQVFAGTCMIVSTGFLIAARWSAVGWTWGVV